MGDVDSPQPAHRASVPLDWTSVVCEYQLEIFKEQSIPWLFTKHLGAAMKCNICWNDMQGVAYHTECNHVFCKNCAKKAFDGTSQCPICLSVLSKHGVTELNMDNSPQAIQDKAKLLYGMQPKDIMMVLGHAMEFWARQRDQECVVHSEEVRKWKEAASNEQKRNEELESRLEMERSQVEEIKNAKVKAESKVFELQAAYDEKCQALRRLAELYESLKQMQLKLENDINMTQVQAQSELRHDEPMRRNYVRMQSNETKEHVQTTKALRPLPAQNPSRPQNVQPPPPEHAETDREQENRYQSPNVRKRKIGARPSHSTESDLQQKHDYATLPRVSGQHAAHHRASSKPALSASTKSLLHFDLRETTSHESPADERHYLGNSPRIGKQKHKGKEF